MKLTDEEKARYEEIQADALLEAASDEIIGMLCEEAKEHIDEKAEEAREEQKERAEEKKEEDKLAAETEINETNFPDAKLWYLRRQMQVWIYRQISSSEAWQFGIEI